jgi:hypothetical protein
MTETRLGSLLLFLASIGCVGSVSDPEHASKPGTPTPGVPGTPSTPAGPPVVTGGSAMIPIGTLGGVSCQEAAPPVTAARRLTRDQYVNTIRDLIGVPTLMAGGDLPNDDVGDNVFPDPRTLIVSPDWASNAMSAAEVAAKAAVANLQTLVPCTPAAGAESACATKFILTFGKRAYRRPLDATEVAGLIKLYDSGARNGGYQHGIEVVVRGMLQSPSFLYRVELGQRAGSSGSAVSLAPYEVASRLSYLVWNSMPDQVLMDAADNDRLSTPDQIAAQARRMMADPRAHATLTSFHQRWLGIDGLTDVPKDPMKYPQYDEKLQTSMRTELGMFLDDVLFKGDGKLESLFTSHFAYVDAALAPLYGVPAPAGGAFTRVDLDPTQRAGIVTDVGLITAHTFVDESSAIHRGKFVREALLCVTPPDPPADLMVMPPEPKPGVSNRERLVEHSTTPSCKACHVMMDPIGFGFEAYDGLGRFRTVDANGKPFDDSGELTMTKDANGTFKGPVGLAAKLAGSSDVRDCLIGNVVRFAQGPDAAGDACVQQKLSAVFEQSKHDIKELFVAIARTDGFRYRRAIAGEVLP